jgi:3-hydroxy-9,10-secoandrosta-1,3,5(10)-triene-9,17-dione monooxygenase reductase component
MTTGMATDTTGTGDWDDADFRGVLGHFCSGVTIVAAQHDGRPVGFTCQSFFSVSIDPPLVAISVAKTSTTYPLIRSVGTMVINVLASDQQSISLAFSRSGTDKWAGVSWLPGRVSRDPIIDGAVASLECSVDSESDAGDHIVVLARVHHLCADSDRRPLLFYQGAYHRLHEGESP